MALKKVIETKIKEKKIFVFTTRVHPEASSVLVFKKPSCSPAPAAGPARLGLQASVSGARRLVG